MALGHRLPELAASKILSVVPGITDMYTYLLQYI